MFICEERIHRDCTQGPEGDTIIELIPEVGDAPEGFKPFIFKLKGMAELNGQQVPFGGVFMIDALDIAGAFEKLPEAKKKAMEQLEKAVRDQTKPKIAIATAGPPMIRNGRSGQRHAPPLRFDPDAR